LAFETARRLRAENEALPVLFVASGRLPPHYAPAESWADRPETELLGYLSTLGGMPPDLDGRMFRSVYLPMIRADFSLNDSLPCGRSPAFGFPITIINGVDDPTVNQDQLPEWQEYTNGVFNSFSMEGDHFFIHKNYREFMALLSDQLAEAPVTAAATLTAVEAGKKAR
jgi:surfactin synthase thioesterase subunit